MPRSAQGRSRRGAVEPAAVGNAQRQVQFREIMDGIDVKPDSLDYPDFDTEP